jgi:hypothetical protein
MEWVWRTFKLRGAPPMTRQQVRMTGYTFTLSDQRARTELGYAPVVSFQEGIDAMRLATRTERAPHLASEGHGPAQSIRRRQPPPLTNGNIPLPLDETLAIYSTDH